jgi:hypothetical protein
MFGQPCPLPDEASAAAGIVNMSAIAEGPRIAALSCGMAAGTAPECCASSDWRQRARATRGRFRSVPSDALRAAEIAQVPLPAGLGPHRLDVALVGEWRRRPRRQTLHPGAPAVGTAGPLVESRQHLGFIVAFPTMKTIERHDRVFPPDSPVTSKRCLAASRRDKTFRAAEESGRDRSAGFGPETENETADQRPCRRFQRQKSRKSHLLGAAAWWCPERLGA